MDRVVPCDSVTEPGPDWEQVALLSPVSPSEYIAWRQKVLAEALSKVKPMDSEKSKQTSAERKKSRAIEVAYPPDLIACLQVQSGWLQHFGWSQPPGTRRVFYWRRHVLETSAPALNLHSREPDTVEAALLSMATAGGNDHALPNITRTLPQAELLHRALIARASRAGRHSIILSGCDANCRPLQTSHRHAHVLPLDLDEDGHLDHILVWAPMGLDGYAQRIIREVRRTFTKGGTEPLRLALAASCSAGDLAGLGGRYGTYFSALTRASLIWRSLTPFVPPRYLKKRGSNTLEGQITSELESRGLPKPASVTVLDPHDDHRFLRHRHFVRVRRFGPLPPNDCGFTLKICFAEAVAGPLALGYGSHFGLGLFQSP